MKKQKKEEEPNETITGENQPDSDSSSDDDDDEEESKRDPSSENEDHKHSSQSNKESSDHEQDDEDNGEDQESDQENDEESQRRKPAKGETKDEKNILEPQMELIEEEEEDDQDRSAYTNLSEKSKRQRLQSFVKLRTEVFRVTQQTQNSLPNMPNGKDNQLIDLNSGFQKVFFGQVEGVDHVKNKKFQNKVRTQRYTIYTWAPLSLIRQFYRAPNVYFLIISILTFLPVSPKNPASMIATFVLVLFCTMLKEAYEDYQRYKMDKEVNNKLANVLNPVSMQWETKKWEEIQPGNIIKFKKDQESPADIAILFSSNASGVVYADTINLDGETNLKEKNALRENFDEQQLHKICGEIRCETPNENLEKWDAQILYRSKNLKPQFANIKNLLLRGCFVKNTVFGIGVVVYTGMETKIMKNLKKPRVKVSNMMKLMNRMLYTVFGFQFILITVFAGLSIKWNSDNFQHSYLNLTTSDDTATLTGRFFLQLLTFWVAYSHMIPISLYVIIEILKLGQASYINKDIQMYDNETASYAKCRNSDLIEELGQVEMVFSDKTGTLTQNKMIFKKCQVNGVRYGERENPEGMCVTGVKELIQHIKEEIRDHKDEEVKVSESEDQTPGETTKGMPKSNYHYVISFLECLALCNTVLCDNASSDGKIQYKASSPDEQALVMGAKQCGIQLVTREFNKVTIFNMINKAKSVYKVLAEFPFDSVRKRQTVIIKDEQGNKRLLCKGADSVMLTRMHFSKNGIEGLKEIVEEDLYYYSCEGLRTLMMGERRISNEEYKEFKKIHQSLQATMSSEKDAKLAQLYDSMEQKMRFLGCSAIEDKLQDGVACTIAKLMQADIRFFMLTGDKLETAIEIAKSCQIIQDDMDVIVFGELDGNRLYSRMSKLLNQMQVDVYEKIHTLRNVELFNQVITIEGSTLALVIGDQELNTMFFHIAIRSRSIVCCRMSPKQKADVVNIFKSRGKWITLAIGDGANDVSMIMEAHIGVGIKGKEGTQAVRSADFAISQFSFLLRLLLYQGRTGYLRVSSMICYYFYKNIVLVFTEFYFAIFNGFSGQIFFLDWLPMLYNAIYTSWHCLFATLLEKDVNEDYSFRYPSIYKAGQLNKYFNYSQFWKWIVLALWHGGVCFYTPMIMGYTAPTVEGLRGEHWLYSTISFTIIVHLVFYKLLLELRHLNWVSFLTGILSLIIYYSTILLAQIPDLANLLQPQALGLVKEMVDMPNFWLMVIAAPIACLTPDIFIRLVSDAIYPSPIDKVLKEYKANPEYDFSKDYKKLEKKMAMKKVKHNPKSEERKTMIEKKKSSFMPYGKDAENEDESNINLGQLVPQDYEGHKKAQKQTKGQDSSTSQQNHTQKSDDDDSSNEDNSRTQQQDNTSSDEEEDQSQSQSQSQVDPSDSSRSQAHDVSMRSDRPMVQAKGKNIEETRKAKKQNKVSKDQITSGEDKNKKSKRISKKVKEEKSMFSVSEVETKSKNKNSGTKKYMDYFEDLNKEINQEESKKSKNADKKDSLQDINDLLDSSLASNNNQKALNTQDELAATGKTLEPMNVKRDIKSQQQEERKKMTVGPDSTKNNKLFSQAKAISQENIKSVRKQSEISEASIQQEKKNKKHRKADNEEEKKSEKKEKSDNKTQHSVPIDKQAFKMIAANRTKNSFLDETSDHIIKPSEIIDNVKPYTVKRKKLTPDTVGNGASGHPLESSRKTPRKDGSDNDVSDKPSRKKKKKYVEKYRDQ